MLDSPKKQLIFGRKTVIEALHNNDELEKILIYKHISSDVFSEVRKLCRGKRTLIQAVPKERLDKITRKNHQGIIAFRALIEYHSMDDIIPFVYEQGETPLIIALDGITDVRNFGAIARTALGMNVHAILIPEKKSAMINSEAIKSSAGALLTIPVCKTSDLSRLLKDLKSHGLKVFGATGKSDHMIPDVFFKDPVVVVLGSEGYGISKPVRAVLDAEFNIPISDKIESYNVSVSAGIVLYEAMRQRGL